VLPGSLRIVLSESETSVMLKDVLQAHADRSDVVLALGPEGGWADDELKLFHEAGWISASLGTTILRAETAAIASLAVVLAELQA
jgi:16S rRNA (uracil1498-N3)-methyltransferase